MTNDDDDDDKRRQRTNLTTIKYIKREPCIAIAPTFGHLLADWIQLWPWH